MGFISTNGLCNESIRQEAASLWWRGTCPPGVTIEANPQGLKAQVFPNPCNAVGAKRKTIG